MARSLVVLCVEDDEDILFIATASLKLDPDISVRGVSSAEKGLRILAQPDEAITCVLLDIQMPHMDGVQMLASIRKLEGRSQTPVIFLTASVGAREIATYQDLDVAGIIPKPFNPISLAKDLRAMLALRAA